MSMMHDKFDNYNDKLDSSNDKFHLSGKPTFIIRKDLYLWSNFSVNFQEWNANVENINWQVTSW